MNMNQFDLPERRKALIEHYWLLILAMENTISFGRPEITQVLSDELNHVTTVLNELGIDPDDWDFDVILTPARWDEEDREFTGQPDTSAFDTFIDELDIDGSKS